MRILHITKKYSNAVGGDVVVVSHLVEQQLAEGHEVLLLTSNCAEIIDEERIYKFGLMQTSSALDGIGPRRIISLCTLFFKTLTIIRKERPDIVHTHSIDMAFFASLAIRLFRIPIVHTFHILSFPDPRLDKFRRKTELLLLKGTKPRIVTAPNQTDVTHLKHAGIANARLVANGIDLTFWKSEKQAHDVFTFITVARLESQKGIEYLIRAVAELKSAETRFKLIIVGDGSLRENLKAIAKSLAVTEIIEFVGRKTPMEIRELYTLSDSAVIPSLWESGPLTSLEAWAMELPLVITKVGIFADEADDIPYAKLIDVGDVNAMAQAMEELMTEPDKCSAMIKAANEVVQQYSWAAMTGILSHAYTEAQGAARH